MKQNLRPSDIARLLGISSQAVRYYEQKGLVQPRRDKDTDYRSYTLQDIERLFACRFWMNYGFSISEVADLFGAAPMSEIPRLLESKKQKFQRQIEDIELTIQKMDMIGRDHQTLPDVLGKYFIKTSPFLLFCCFAEGGLVKMELADSPFYQKLNLHPHLCDTAVIIPSETAHAEQFFEKRQLGFVLEKRYAEFLQIDYNQPGDQVQLFSPTTCVNVTLKVKALVPEELEPVFSWIRKHGFTVSGPIICRIIGTLWSGGVFYYEIWVPIHTD